MQEELQKAPIFTNIFKNRSIHLVLLYILSDCLVLPMKITKSELEREREIDLKLILMMTADVGLPDAV